MTPYEDDGTHGAPRARRLLILPELITDVLWHCNPYLQPTHQTSTFSSTRFF